MSEYARHITGKWGEDVACKYLQMKGYKIYLRNFSCRQGEIDIIAKDKREIVFIEVKTRNNESYGKPVDSVNNIKQKHIYEASRYFAYSNHLENSYIRYDIIEILKKDKYYINHIKNVEIKKFPAKI